MIPQISHATACALVGVVERRRRQIMDKMLVNFREAMYKHSLALDLAVGQFLDRFIDAIDANDPERLVMWLRSVKDPKPDLPDIRQIFAAGCAIIAAEYRIAGCDGADVVEFFANAHLEIERAVSAAMKSEPVPPAPEEVVRDEAINALLSMLETHDPRTLGHARSVGAWSARIAREMQFMPETVAFVERCGLLHDIGKVTIPTEILDKASMLDAVEWTRMRNQPAAGAETLSRIPTLRDCAPVVRSHHERFDGTGYPEGLHASHIPVAARIVAVADAYDAMVSRRAYRRSLTPAQAIKTLAGGRGTQWDPSVVDAFTRLFSTSERTITSNLTATA